MTAAGADPGPPSDIADEGLAEAGRARIDWARRGMPVLRLITERYEAERPFAGLTVAACLEPTWTHAAALATFPGMSDTLYQEAIAGIPLAIVWILTRD